MRQISGVILLSTVLKENAEIRNCFFCNFENGAILADVNVVITIDSCFFEENYNFDHGGALNLKNTKNVTMTKIFGKSCCTKGLGSDARYGQFGFINVTDTYKFFIFFTDSCLSSCAPFIEMDDRRSVIELFNGKQEIKNVNFSNNMANAQILRPCTADTLSAKQITFFQNVLTIRLIIAQSYGISIFERIQFAKNSLGSDKTAISTNADGMAIYTDCSFQDCNGYKFIADINSTVTFKSCYFQEEIMKVGDGKISIVSSVTTTPQSFNNPLMREVIQEVLKKGYCSASQERYITLIGMISCLIKKDSLDQVYSINASDAKKSEKVINSKNSAIELMAGLKNQ